MSRELLDYDPLTGMATYHHYDEGTDTTHVESVQDVEPILNINKIAQNEGSAFYKRDPDMWHAATIPVSIIQKWWVEDGINVYDKHHWPDVKKKLNDPAWKYLRTGEFNL